MIACSVLAWRLGVMDVQSDAQLSYCLVWYLSLSCTRIGMLRLPGLPVPLATTSCAALLSICLSLSLAHAFARSGYLGALPLATSIGILSGIFTFLFMFYDSDVPGNFPPTPVSPRRQQEYVHFLTNIPPSRVLTPAIMLSLSSRTQSDTAISPELAPGLHLRTRQHFGCLLSRAVLPQTAPGPPVTVARMASTSTPFMQF